MEKSISLQYYSNLSHNCEECASKHSIVSLICLYCFSFCCSISIDPEAPTPTPTLTEAAAAKPKSGNIVIPTGAATIPSATTPPIRLPSPPMAALFSFFTTNSFQGTCTFISFLTSYCKFTATCSDGLYLIPNV